MSANPRSPESGDVPEWVQKRIAEATDELYGDDNVIRWLADALSTAREPAKCSACAGTGKPVSGRPCICGGVGTEAAELTGLRRELSTARERADRAEQDSKRMRLLRADHNAIVRPYFNEDRSDFGVRVDLRGEHAWGLSINEALDALHEKLSPASTPTPTPDHA